MKRSDHLYNILTKFPQLIDKQIFFILDFQLCYKTDEFSIPIEICIKPMGNIPQIESFHCILNQTIPIQHYLNSKHYSTFEHGITNQNNPSNQTDYLQLWRKMSQYIKDIMNQYSENKLLPIIIATPFRSSISCIEYLSIQAKIEDVRKTVFSVMFSVDDFIECMNKFNENNGYMNTNSIYNFYKPMLLFDVDSSYQCDFHKKVHPRSFCCSKANCEYLVSSLFSYFRQARNKIVQIAVANMPQNNPLDQQFMQMDMNFMPPSF